LPIQFELCQDPLLLRQYYQLREACFRRELGLPGFDGSEEQHDRQGLILIAHQDGQCIGGARISSNVPAARHLHKLDLAADACCIWERFVMDPAVRTVQMVRDFCAHLIEASRVSGYQHALVLSSLRNARFYRQCHSALGVGFKIHGSMPDCAEGEFARLEHYLSVAQLHEEPVLSLAA
jgi:hypothetical protein